jgi:hypothetical protein
MANRPDIQRNGVIGFFLENKPHWQVEVEKHLYRGVYFTLHIYLRRNISFIHNSLFILTIGGKFKPQKCTKCLP